MANSTVIAATLTSVRQLLQHCFDALLLDDPQAFRAPPNVVLARTEDFANPSDVGSLINDSTLSIFCNRVDINRTMRPAWAGVSAQDGRIHLPLDVHFLITPWDTDTDGELRMLGAAMQCLEQHPILTGPQLDARGAWAPGEAIQITFEDILTEDVLRTFENLPNDFQLSVGYIARVARIDASDVQVSDVTDAVRGLTASSVPTP